MICGCIEFNRIRYIYCKVQSFVIRFVIEPVYYAWWGFWWGFCLNIPYNELGSAINICGIHFYYISTFGRKTGREVIKVMAFVIIVQEPSPCIDFLISGRIEAHSLRYVYFNDFSIIVSLIIEPAYYSRFLSGSLYKYIPCYRA